MLIYMQKLQSVVFWERALLIYINLKILIYEALNGFHIFECDYLCENPWKMDIRGDVGLCETFTCAEMVGKWNAVKNVATVLHVY